MTRQAGFLPAGHNHKLALNLGASNACDQRPCTKDNAAGINGGPPDMLAMHGAGAEAPDSTFRVRGINAG